MSNIVDDPDLIQRFSGGKPFVIQTVSHHGVSHPVHARLQLQTMEMVEATKLSPADREKLLLGAMHLSGRLVNGYEAVDDLKRRSDQQFEELKEKDRNRTGPGREIPYVVGLEVLFEGFVYGAKNILRDAGDLCAPLFGRRFAEAKDWCAFGKEPVSEVERHLLRLAEV